MYLKLILHLPVFLFRNIRQPKSWPHKICSVIFFRRTFLPGAGLKTLFFFTDTKGSCTLAKFAGKNVSANIAFLTFLGNLGQHYTGRIISISVGQGK
jgi:hypothetical protein